jgi:hypothetical protein
MNAVYLAGYHAFKKHLPQSDNPYTEEAEKQQWDEGWEDAKMDADRNRPQPCHPREP